MILKVAKSVAAAAIASDLASQSEDGRLMHIALTRPLERTDRGSVSWFQFRATVDQWVEMASWCASNATVGPGDGRQAERLAAAVARTGARIWAEMDRLAKHPGYRGLAVLGTSQVQLPAYRCGNGRWWPTKAQAIANADGTTTTVERTDLTPSQVQVGARIFTRWD